MHLVALSLLLAAAALLVATFVLPIPAPLVGYLRAFAEAALVGGLADWFAVVALFRHPMGVPIPHTAIVPTNKDRIGQALGDFVQANFLTREVLTRHLANADLAGGIGRVLADGAHAGPLAARLSELVPEVVDALDATRARELLREQLARALRGMDVLPLLREALQAVLTETRREQLFDALLDQAHGLLDAAEPELRRRVHARSGWVVQQLRVDERIADRILEAAADLLEEVEGDPRHDWRMRFQLMIDDFLARLGASEGMHAEAEAVKASLLAQPLFARVVDDLWNALTGYLRDAALRGESGLHRYLERALAQMGEQLLADPAAREALDDWLRRSLVDIAVDRRHLAAELIAGTVREWDAATIAGKLEDAVGRDLQFIRINGTLIGGLVGVLLHAAGQLASG